MEIRDFRKDGVKAIVIYDSRYGNTEKIARSFKGGLEEAGIQADCVNGRDCAVDSLRQYDLICVGAPTEAFTASKPIKEFLEKLESTDLSGKFGFAFDTKASPGIFGSAAKFIEKDLKDRSLQIISPRESAIVFTGGSTSSARLKEGEDKKFEVIGTRVGSALLAAVRERTIPA